jgi:hypothetical protein
MSALSCESSSPVSNDSSRASSPPTPWMRRMVLDHNVSSNVVVADDARTCHRPNPELTTAPSPHSRNTRPPTLLPINLTFENPPNFAINPSNNYYHHSRQDVRDFPVNAPATRHSSTPSSGHNVTVTSPLESRALSSSGSNHVPINETESRPRTSNQVFHTTSDLAAHHGIPQFLPPVPRTTPRSLPASENPIDSNVSLEEYLNNRSNYLTMLSQNPDHTETEDHTAMVPDVQAFMEVLAGEWGLSRRSCEILKLTRRYCYQGTASPEFQNENDVMGEFMTSPFDSPWDEFLPTPALDSTDVVADVLKSPVMDADLPLFGDAGLYDMSPKTDAPTSTTLYGDCPGLDFGDLYSMSSPITPALDPASLYASPCESTTMSPFPSAPTSSHRKSTATGTRKNITPDALVPVDAPTQHRTYASPSATSRKEVPAVFARKRARSSAFGDEDDQLPDEAFTLPPNATEAQLIEAKRRQNTIAARRSRKRKLEHQRELEETNQRLQSERDHWKARATTCEALLRYHGLEVPQHDS